MIEDPVASGFADAAKSLTDKFQALIPASMKKNDDLWTELRFRFPRTSATVRERVIEEPLWLDDTPEARKDVKLQNSAPASDANAIKSAMLDCEVASGLTLEGCRVSVDGQPAASMADQANRFVSGRRISAWSDEGEPVDGARVRMSFSPVPAR
jgi:hypothetical protein